MSKKKTYEELVDELETLEQKISTISMEVYDLTDALDEAIYVAETDTGCLKPLVSTKIVKIVAELNEAINKHNALVKLGNAKERLLQKRT